MTQTWESREVLLDVEIFVDALAWQSLVLRFVCFHLGDEVDEVLRFLEKFQLLSIDQVAKLVLNLNNELDHVQGVQTVVAEVAIEGDASLLGSSEVVLENAEDIFLDLVVALEHEGVLLLGLQVLPQGNLIGGLVLGWHEVDGRVEAKVALEASSLGVHKGSAVLSIDASAEANVVAWLHHLRHSWVLASKASCHDS